MGQGEGPGVIRESPSSEGIFTVPMAARPRHQYDSGCCYVCPKGRACRETMLMVLTLIVIATAIIGLGLVVYFVLLEGKVGNAPILKTTTDNIHTSRSKGRLEEETNINDLHHEDTFPEAEVEAEPEDGKDHDSHEHKHHHEDSHEDTHDHKDSHEHTHDHHGHDHSHHDHHGHGHPHHDHSEEEEHAEPEAEGEPEPSKDEEEDLIKTYVISKQPEIQTPPVPEKEKERNETQGTGRAGIKFENSPIQIITAPEILTTPKGTKIIEIPDDDMTLDIVISHGGKVDYTPDGDVDIITAAVTPKWAAHGPTKGSRIELEGESEIVPIEQPHAPISVPTSREPEVEVTTTIPSEASNNEYSVPSRRPFVTNTETTTVASVSEEVRTETSPVINTSPETKTVSIKTNTKELILSSTTAKGTTNIGSASSVSADIETTIAETLGEFFDSTTERKTTNPDTLVSLMKLLTSSSSFRPSSPEKLDITSSVGVERSTEPEDLKSSSSQTLNGQFSSPAVSQSTSSSQETASESSSQHKNDSCVPRGLDFCLGILPYDSTLLPNLAGDQTQLEVVRNSLPYFQIISASQCSPRAHDFLCTLLEPKCKNSKIIPPCRKFCKAVMEKCFDFNIESLPLSNAFDCDQYPDTHDPEVCINLSKADECFPGEYQCPDKTCIPKTWMCDKVRDCPDSGDERNCTSCKAGEFRCVVDQQCVPFRWKCDGNQDCIDGSDELGCPQSDACPSGHFQCKDKTDCIPKRWVCDGSNQCRDDSDELDCENQACQRDDFKCKTSGLCVPASFRCDGSPDCRDASDEDACPPGSLNSVISPAPSLLADCPDGKLRCLDGKCIMLSQICDGEIDCSDKTDERNCGIGHL